MLETLREVSPNIWVSDMESASIVGADFTLVIDCTGKGQHRDNVVHLRPTGSTSHAWTVTDLDAVAQHALAAQGPVLVHCRRGVSRSPCAAAAAILALGRAKTVDQALAMTKYQDATPASQSVAGLRKWWKERQPRPQLALFPA